MQTSTAHAAPDSNGQLTLPGCEEFAAPPPKPTLSYNARRVLEVIQGYAKGAWGYCGAFQKTLAQTLGRWVRGKWKPHSVRWLYDALAELKALRLISVRHRGPHASEYHIDKKIIAELLPSIAPASSITECKESRTECDAKKSSRKQPRRASREEEIECRREEWDRDDEARGRRLAAFAKQQGYPLHMWPWQALEYAS